MKQKLHVPGINNGGYNGWRDLHLLGNKTVSITGKIYFRSTLCISIATVSRCWFSYSIWIPPRFCQSPKSWKRNAKSVLTIPSFPVEEWCWRLWFLKKKKKRNRNITLYLSFIKYEGKLIFVIGNTISSLWVNDWIVQKVCLKLSFNFMMD